MPVEYKVQTTPTITSHTHLHAEWLVWCQGVKVIEIWLSEDDSILRRGTPCLHEMHSISTAQGRVSCEHHTGGLVHSPQTPVHIGEVLQAPTTDELWRGERKMARRNNETND